MTYKETFIQSFNHSKGRVIIPKGIILHHIYLKFDDIIKIFTERKGVLSDGREFSGVSPHVLIRKNGERFVFNQDLIRAWHAGKSEFKGKKNCNDFMLGVEFEGNTNEERLTFDQLTSFQEWAIPRIEKYNIKFDWITTHARVAPGRKTDISETEFTRIQYLLTNIYK